MMKFILPLLVGLFCLNICPGQNLSALKIGDKVPGITLQNLLNEHQKELKLSQLKAKLIILDFWNIHCPSCIAGMPEMDSLQKEFKNDIQVIYVTKNSSEEVNKLFSRIKVKKPSVPFVVSDTMLNSLFPHNGDPLHVWINENGIVQAITFDYNSNQENITKFLNGIELHLDRRWDFGINIQAPLISEENNGLLTHAEEYSVLFKGLYGYSVGSGIYIMKDSNNLPFRITTINTSLLQLYNVAFDSDIFGMEVNNFQLSKNNRIILETKDSSVFFQTCNRLKVGDWNNNYLFCYEIKLNVASRKEIYSRMEEDLNRYFPYNAKIEKRKVKCMALTKLSSYNEQNLKTKNPQSPTAFVRNKDRSISFQNLPMNNFVLQLIYANADNILPIINETQIAYNIDMHLCSKLSDRNSLNEELQQYGLALQEKEIEIKALIIKDK